jgi:NADH-quinone oxidoreductase subunit J
MMWPFYLMALVAIVSTVRVVTNANPVHALLSLIVSLLAVAGMFMIVGAPFAGALEIIVYAGAIMVLFVFVVMMHRHQSRNKQTGICSCRTDRPS